MKMPWFSVAAVLTLSALFGQSNGQLSESFYASTCPNLTNIVREMVQQALQSDVRITASLVRLHFHDCFVQGCEGSILLDNATNIVTEKDAVPNVNSVRGYELVDSIKAALETACPRVVSCSDILTVAASVSVALSNGPSYYPPLGRRDGTTANITSANNDLPSPFADVPTLVNVFAALNLTVTDLVALSGAHTFGRAQCGTFSPRLTNFTNGNPDPTINATFLPSLQRQCPQNGNATVLNNLDVDTPNTFDNRYFTNLQTGRGLLFSDQTLFSTSNASTVAIVNAFSSNETLFFESFVNAMIKMGNLRVLTGTSGQIRSNCRRVNANTVKDGFLRTWGIAEELSEV